jgi:hypothetical protein
VGRSTTNYWAAVKARAKPLVGALLTSAVLFGAPAALATPATLDAGLVQMGVDDSGGLGANGVGFVGPNGDAIIRGCLCEGWGAAADGNSGYVYGLSRSNFVSAVLTTTDPSGADLSAQSVVQLGNGLMVTQTYSSVAGGKLFKINILLTNTTAGTLTDVRYARTLDWDVAPGFFGDNYTTVNGGALPIGPGNTVLNTSTNPFAPPDPMVFRTQDADTNVTDTIGDKGGYFVFGFGDLAAGSSTSFDTYIGADSTVSGLLAALGSVGAEAFSYTTGSDRGSDGHFAPAFGYGFAGLGLPPVIGTPEPGSIAMLLIGLALLAGLEVYRRKREHAA